MSIFYNNIFRIPPNSLIDRKLPKTFFLKNFELSSAEKKFLNSSIKNMEWLASIKPKVANIAMFANSNYSYEEIQIVICTVDNNQLESLGMKCIDLLQKYIPYQMLVVVEDEFHYIINSADKRINLNNASKRTIEGFQTTKPLSKLYISEIDAKFLEAISYLNLDKTNMETTYKSYIQAIVQLKSSAITGEFQRNRNSNLNDEIAILDAIEKHEKEIFTLKNQLKKETQIKNKVYLNIEIETIKKQVEKLRTKISTT